MNYRGALVDGTHTQSTHIAGEMDAVLTHGILDLSQAFFRISGWFAGNKCAEAPQREAEVARRSANRYPITHAGNGYRQISRGLLTMLSDVKSWSRSVSPSFPTEIIAHAARRSFRFSRRSPQEPPWRCREDRGMRRQGSGADALVKTFRE